MIKSEWCGPIFAVSTSLLWPPICCRHALAVVCCSHLFSLAAWSLWPPVCYGHLFSVATCSLWHPVCCGHLFNVVTCSVWSPVCCGYLLLCIPDKILAQFHGTAYHRIMCSWSPVKRTNIWVTSAKFCGKQSHEFGPSAEKKTVAFK